MRRFVIWMFAPETPHWSMPSWSSERIREALDPEWEIESIRIALEASGDGVRVTPPELLEAVADAEVYCGWGIRRDVFLAARRLRWFHSGAAGARNSLFREMRESDVIFTNSAGMYADSLADHALAGILYFARGLDVAVRAQRRREWVQTALNSPRSPLHALPPAGEVAGASLGIIGYGGIGSALGRRAHALGMRVQAIRRRVGARPPELDRLEGPDFLPTLLETSDYVALTAPRRPTPEASSAPRNSPACGRGPSSSTSRAVRWWTNRRSSGRSRRAACAGRCWTCSRRNRSPPAIPCGDSRTSSSPRTWAAPPPASGSARRI